ncbi:MAG: substrate-binding domain-containing protein, partial [Planctomycetota bacterium]
MNEVFLMMKRRHFGGAQTLVVVSLVVVVALIFLLTLNSRQPTPHDGAGGDGVSAQPLVLYCAAGIMKPVQAAADQYEKEFGVRIQIEPGGSGKLLSQIKVTQGRGHLYLAADRSYTDQARADGLVRETLAVSRIHPVIAVAPGNPKGIASVADLLKAEIKVAMANPDLASVGRTTRKLLQGSGQWEALEARSKDGSIGLSFTGTVNEVAQAIKIGSVDAGVIWDSNARQFGLDIVEAEPLASHINTITIGVLEPNDRPTAALQFARYLTARDRGQLQFELFTYDTLKDADVWSDHPEVLIMAGAMLKPGIEDAIQAFEQREGVTIKPVYN